MPSPDRALVLGSVSETEFQRWVIDTAHRAGWLVHHDHDSRKQEWGTDAGFPDLVLARRGRVIFAELKTARGSVMGDQRRWANALIGPVDFYVWRPADEGLIERTLA
jgi:hypothetical protein